MNGFAGFRRRQNNDGHLPGMAGARCRCNFFPAWKRNRRGGKLKRQNRPAPWLAGLAIILVAAVASFLPLTLADQLELKLLDLRFRLFQRSGTGPPVTIIAVDSRSEQALGRWPWDRDVHAGLVDRLAAAGAAVIAFDIVFAQPQETRLARLAADPRAGLSPEQAERIRALVDDDRALAEAISRAGNVVLGYYFLTGAESDHRPDPGRAAAVAGLLEKTRFDHVFLRPGAGTRAVLTPTGGVEMPVEPVARAAAALGFLNVFQDPDGVLRRSVTALDSGDGWHPSFAVEVVRQYTGRPASTLEIDEYGLSGLRIGSRSVPVSDRGQFLVDYTTDKSAFPVFSFADVLDGAVAEEHFRDRIVLVGITDPGLIRDEWTTPTALLAPGVKTQALAITTMLEDRYPLRSGGVELVNLLVLLFSGLLVIFAVTRFQRALAGTVISAGVFGGIVVLSLGAFQLRYVWLDMAYPLATVLVVYLLESFWREIRGERRTRAIKTAFQSYVPPAVVEDLVRNPDKLRLGGERKIVSVLYSDIRGFTTMSEKLSPEDLAQVMNRYFSVMTEVVFARSGTLDKYIGDALLAFFGAPLDQPDHARRAVLTALGMTAALAGLNRAGLGFDLPPLRIGIGINTGEVSVGNMGSKMRFDYTVLGDNVNIAQRLEELTRDYQVGVLISAMTFQAVTADILCREIDLVAIRGRRQPLPVYEPLAPRAEAPESARRLAALSGEALAALRRGDKAAAAGLFRRLQKEFPGDGPTRFHLERLDRPGPGDVPRNGPFSPGAEPGHPGGDT